jgi:hypothetical protein
MNYPVLLLHGAATLAMVGLIWFVQIVHYPLFAQVGRDHFAQYEWLHQARTAQVVGPLMLTEAITATLLLLSDLTPAARNLAWIGMALLVVIWLSTAFLQVPLHRQLAAGYDSQSAARLVRSNWLRTIAWTLRGFIAMSLLPAVGLF